MGDVHLAQAEQSGAGSEDGGIEMDRDERRSRVEIKLQGQFES